MRWVHPDEPIPDICDRPAYCNTSSTQDDNNSTTDNPYPNSVTAVFCVTYAIIFLLGGVGNLITLTVILKTKYLQTKTNYYLCSLAVSDLVVLLFGLPFEVLYLVKPYIFPGGTWLCVLRGLVSETATNASVLAVVAFTIERWLAICKPFGSKLTKCSKVASHMVIIWLVSVTGAIPLAYQFNVRNYYDPCTCQPDPNISACVRVEDMKLAYSFELSSIVFFGLPMLLIAGVYISIIKQLKKTFKVAMGSFDSPMFDQSRALRNRVKMKSGVVRKLIIIVIAFFICFSPYHMQRLLTTYVEEMDFTYDSNLLRFMNVLYGISGFLYYMSTTVNPLNSLWSRKFRAAYNGLFVPKRTVQVRKVRFNVSLNRLNGYSSISAAERQKREELENSNGPCRHDG